MYYKLHPGVSLRSWPGIPYACCQSGMGRVHILTLAEYLFLEQCDGTADFVKTPLLEEMLTKRYIVPCEKGDSIEERQRMYRYENLYFPSINIAVTGRCNYNCRHCFAAKDEYASSDELTCRELCELLDDCVSCGIHNVSFTGGEPFIHRDFSRLIEEIAKRRLYLMEIATNGSMITAEKLDFIREMGEIPRFKISFDGIGHHDWMRQAKGAEESALRAIRLVKEKGMEVMIQTCLDRENTATLYDTALRMESLGVGEMRVIRISESPRWLALADRIGMTPEEYFDVCLSFLERYCREEHQMDLTIWGLGYYNAREKSLDFLYERKLRQRMNKQLPVCTSYRETVFVNSDGSLAPCQPQSGYMAKHGLKWGNIRKNRLKELLKDSEYIKHVTCTLGELLGQNDTCASCVFFPMCRGGCRAIGYGLTGNYFGADRMQCVFFKKGFFERAQRIKKVQEKGGWPCTLC